MTDLITAYAAMPATFTATNATGRSKGTFSALVSAANIPYRIYNGAANRMETHTIMPGAFASTDGTKIPLFYNHASSSDPMALPIGAGLATETEDGLLIEGKLNIANDDQAAKVHWNMVEGSLTSHSIGYAIAASEIQNNDETDLHVTEAHVVESSICQTGRNPGVKTLAVASAALAAKVADDDVDLMDLIDIEAIAAAVIDHMDEDELAFRLAQRIDSATSLAAKIAQVHAEMEPQAPVRKKIVPKAKPVPVRRYR